jgi:hypothetical protein
MTSMPPTPEGLLCNVLKRVVQEEFLPYREAVTFVLHKIGRYVIKVTVL